MAARGFQFPLTGSALALVVAGARRGGAPLSSSRRGTAADDFRLAKPVPVGKDARPLLASRIPLVHVVEWLRAPACAFYSGIGRAARLIAAALAVTSLLDFGRGLCAAPAFSGPIQN